MTPRRFRAAVRGLLAGGLVALATSAPATASASHPEARADGSTVWLLPADGVFPITGHGFGHGHGLSQWGAQGAAEQGLAASAILDAFYPGTQTAAPGPRPIRVALAGAGTAALTVWPAAGLTVTDLAGGRVDTGTGAAIALPSGPQRWRVLRTATGFDVQSDDGTAWTTFGGAHGLAGPVRFADTAGIVRVLGTDGSSRDYRGTVSAAANGSGTALRVIDAVELDDYVRGVVPRESPSSWKPAALQAQAVASRSYAAYAISHPAGATYDICDTSACQAYGGKHLYQSDGDDYELETPNTDAAVVATAHQVRTYDGSAIFAQFSASDGGWTVDGGQPYLSAHADPWDGVDPANTGHTWGASLSAAALQKAFPAVGTLTSLEVTSRDGNGDWGGRVGTVVLHGTDGSGNDTTVSTTGNGIANAYSWPAHSDGLRSSWWTVGQDAAPQQPPPTAPGLVPIPPHLVLATSGAGLVAHTARALQLGRLLPAGASAVVLAVDARGVGGGLLTGEPTGRPALRVPLTTVANKAGTSGVDVVRVAAKGGVTLRLTAGTAAVRVRVIGAVAPGGVVPTGARPTGALRYHATTPPMAFTIAGSTRLGTAGTGAGLSLAIPVTATVTATGHAVTLNLPRFTLPAGRHGALFAVTTTAAARLAPTGSPTAGVALAAPTQPSTTSLVVLPQRDRRISVVARKGTLVTVTVVGWV